MMETLGLYGMYDFLHIPFWQTAWFKGSVGVALVLGIFAAIVFLWRTVKVRARKRPVWERALALLDKLSKQDFATVDARRAFYSDLTKLLKEYCVERYGWDVGGLTDQECICFLAEKKVDTRLQHTFKRITQGCETIKFAQESVDHERMQADFLLCQEFIRATIPSEQR